MDANVPKFLITRLSAIGDTIATLPVLTTLRRARPDAFIAWAVEKPSNQFLELHPDLDEVVVVPKGWLANPASIMKIRAKLRRFRFDVAIDPQGITKSAALGWLSGAKQRIGLRGQWGRELSTWLNNDLVETESSHITRRSVELLSAVGIEGLDLDALESGLPTCRDSLTTVEDRLASAGVPGRFAMINPGAGWPSKQWETERWGEVAAWLYREHALCSVITWAGDDEFAMAEQIHAIDRQATTIAPRTNLRELAALAGKAVFAATADTGPMHIAAAMGTPCVSLFGSTRPEDSGAYGLRNIAIQKWHQTTDRKGERSDNAAMRDITVEDVCLACEDMLGRLGQSLAA